MPDETVVLASLHERLAADGYSWIDYAGGPKDGGRSYFKGPPLFHATFCEPEDAATFGAGDRVYGYTLTAGADGYAVYRYAGAACAPTHQDEPPF